MPTASKEKGTQHVPAYVPFKTFRTFLDAMDASAPPKHIDRGMMPSLSGAMQSRLINALEFLGLITHDGEVTDSLREYLKVRSKEDQRKAVLRSITDDAYQEIVGDLDIETCSPLKLQEAFRAAGVDGSTLYDAIRFYIRVRQEVGAKISSYVLKGIKKSPPKKNGVIRTRTQEKVRDHSPQTAQDTKGSDIPPGMIPLPLYPYPRKAFVPDDLTESDCETLDAMARAYAKSASHSQKGKK